MRTLENCWAADGSRGPLKAEGAIPTTEVSRISLGPDGAIYAGSIGDSGNWGQQARLKKTPKACWTGC
ncbi:hypothetical protein [Streptomyces niveus]|uniref:hypothetical protein n=1 Tax=Streptomyces niveus TaxID=193462 RepID=UPI0036D34A6A